MNPELFGISIYVLGMLGVGFYVSKKIKTDDDYFLAGRSLGPFLATFSIFATWFGAETCVGTAGAVYREGIYGSHADPFGYALCILLMGVFFAKLLWKKGITTIPDLLRQRYNPLVEKLTAIVLIPSSLVWAGAQIRAFGQILHSNTDFGVNFAITLAACVVVIYTIFGGLLADAYTDLVQGIALIIGLIIIVVVMVVDLGGISESFNSFPREKLSFINPHTKTSFLSLLEVWMVPILGSLMSQELVSRVVASKSPEVAANSSYRAAGIYLCVGFFPIILGLLGGNYLPNLQEAETIMPMMAKQHLNFFFYIIFIGALVSAILSTVDSTLLAASALLSHNLIFPALKEKKKSERKKVLIARTGVFCSGVIAYLIAYSSESITGLVETASSLGGPIILVLASLALFEKKGNSTQAMFSIVFGLISWIVFEFFIEVQAPIIYTVLITLIVYFIPPVFRTRGVG